MTNPVVLMNFRIPANLKAEFEATCRQLNMPMTSQINMLMRAFVLRHKASRLTLDDNADAPLSFYSDADDTL